MKKIVMVFMCFSMTLAFMAGCKPSTAPESSPTATTAPSATTADNSAAKDESSDINKDSQTANSAQDDYSNSGSLEEGSTIKFKTITTEGEEVDSVKLFAEHDLTVINLWGTFCQPCIMEMPDLEKIHKAYENVNVLGIVVDVTSLGSKSLIKAKAVMEKTGVTYQSILPSKEMIAGFCGEAQYVPTTLFVDKNGVVIGKYLQGAKSEQEFKKEIDNRLADIK